MSLPISAVIKCCDSLVQQLLKSDIGIPLSLCNNFDRELLIGAGLARIDIHRGEKVLKGTKALFDNCSNCN